MANFTGTNIKDTYFSILNVGNSGALGCCLASSGQDPITDGAGNAAAFSVGRSGQGMTVTGPFTNSGGSACVSTTGNLQAACVCQSGATGNVSIDGDLFVGDPSDRKFSVDNSTGLITTCGAINIGSACLTTNQTITNKGTLVNEGVIYGCNDIIAFSTSDKRLKNDLNKIESSKNILNGLNGYTFTWKEKAARQGYDLGIVAQEVREVLPEIVHEREDGYLSVDYIKLIPVLIEEVKRLSKEIDDLKNA